MRSKRTSVVLFFLASHRHLKHVVIRVSYQRVVNDDLVCTEEEFTEGAAVPADVPVELSDLQSNDPKQGKPRFFS